MVNKYRKLSFVIYLVHNQIAGIINSRFIGLLEYIKVPVAVLITIGVVILIKYIVRKFRLDSLSRYFGFR